MSNSKSIPSYKLLIVWLAVPVIAPAMEPIPLQVEKIYSLPGEGFVRDFAVGPSGIYAVVDKREVTKIEDSQVLHINMDGNLSYRSTLPAVAYSFGTIAVSASGAAAVAQSSSGDPGGHITIFSPTGAIRDHFRTQREAVQLAFRGEQLLGMGQDGVFEPEPTSNLGRIRSPIPILSYPVTMFVDAMGKLAVIDFQTAKVRFVDDNGALAETSLNITLPEWFSAPSETPLLFAAAADTTGSLYCALSAFRIKDGVSISKIERGGNGVSAQYALSLDSIPEARIIPGKLRTDGVFLYLSFFRSSRIARYRLP